MRTPVVLPSYVSTLLNGQRTQASQATWPMPATEESRKQGAIQARQRLRMWGRLKHVIRAGVAEGRRIPSDIGWDLE